MEKRGHKVADLINTKGEEHGREVREVKQACRLLEKAAALYGRRRVERALRDLDLVDGCAWVSYWRRWRAREDAHLMPRAVLSEGYFAVDNVANRLAFTPQAAARRAA